MLSNKEKAEATYNALKKRKEKKARHKEYDIRVLKINLVTKANKRNNLRK